jgi:DNA modification methylase
MILSGDCLDTLPGLDAGSCRTCVTSPPYFGLRDYGHAGQIGLEPTPDEYVARLVAVFREVRRVLTGDGTLWLNLGDSYAGSGRGVGDTKTGNMRNPASRGVGSKLPAGLHESQRLAGAVGRAWVKPPLGLKPKDLIGIPWMVAFALRADGWYLRSDIIWHKPNPMPESVTDRPTKSHEYLFLLSKSERYFYDADAIAERLQGAAGLTGGAYAPPGQSPASNARTRSGNKQRDIPSDDDGRGIPNTHLGRGIPWEDTTGTRNARTVWTIPTKPFKGAHFATFPEELARRCILAGSARSDTVLDPFGGAGTVGVVAVKEGRESILCELNPDYCEMARRRIADTQPPLGMVAS